MDKNKIRESYLDIAKGIGIILVVFGHSFPDENTASGIRSDFFRFAVQVIYTFHMPLFFMISGYLSEKLLDGDPKALIQKARRLLIPYIFMSVLYIPLRIFASGMSSSSYDLKDLWKIIIGISPNGGVWFLYVMFLCCAVTFLLRKKAAVFTAAAAAFVLAVLSRGEYIAVSYSVLKYFFYNYFFFLLGLIVKIQFPKAILRLSKMNVIIPAAVSAALIPLVCICGFRFLICVLSCAEIAFTVKLSLMICGRENKEGILSRLGKDSMYIYLFHGPVQVVIRYILWNRLSCNYYVCAAVMFVSGLAVSWFAAYFIIGKIGILRFLCGGEWSGKKGT